MSAPRERRPPPPFPVTIVTGFLGAGKTTLLNDLIRDGALADAVVLINEFGDIGLDHLLVERIDGDMLLMASGCLCCTIRGDLVNALEGLLRRRDNARIAPFARVVIETTGLADPVPVLQTILGHPYFALRFRLAAVVTVVDAVNGRATLTRHREAARQVALADRIVVSKSDLDSADPAALHETLAALNPHAPQLFRAKGEATPAALLATSGVWLAKHHALVSDDGAPSHEAHDHGHHGHGHDPNRHSAAVRSVSLVHDKPLDAQAVTLFLDLLQRSLGPKLLRLKGLVALADDPARPLVIHAVQHLLHPPHRLDTWPDGDRRSRIVVITDGVAPADVQSLFAAICGDLAPDQPDRDALSANPLALRTNVGLLG